MSINYEAKKVHTMYKSCTNNAKTMYKQWELILAGKRGGLNVQKIYKQCTNSVD